MKKKKIILILLAIFTFSFAILGYILQFKITKYDNEIKVFNKEISQIDDEIKILETELIHLTSITKLKDISYKYLKQYKDISKNDFIKIMDIPVNTKLN